MAYQRFKIAELSLPPATLATFATLQGENSPNVASVATVARPKPEIAASQGVATVAETRRAPVKPAPSVPIADHEPATIQKSDAELYADALKRHSPGSYGSIGVILGWGMTRAANAETVLREAGRIRYDHTGRGVFVDGPIPSQPTGEKS